jgi:RNA polymerase sigma-70 factor (ECF subfamily)
MPMDCREMFARLSEYVDGELPPELCDEFARHFEACLACEAFTRTLRETIDLCHRLPPRPLPEALRLELRAMLGETDRSAS